MRQRVTDAAAGAVSADEQIIGHLPRVLTGRAQPQAPGRQVKLLPTVHSRAIQCHTCEWSANELPSLLIATITGLGSGVQGMLGHVQRSSEKGKALPLEWH